MAVRYKSNKQLFRTQLKTGLQQNLGDAARHYVERLWPTLSGRDRSGRRYRIPGTDTYYTASAPGEPPARATGRLVDSFEIHKMEGKNQLVARIGSRLEYALYLELGTARIAQRPYFRVTFERNEGEIKRICRRPVTNA